VNAAALFQSESRRLKDTPRRNRVNRLFLLACLIVTSLSVLALVVLLTAVVLQGTRPLFGFEFLVVPRTDGVQSIALDADQHRIVFTYEDDAPHAPDAGVRFVFPPTTIDLETARIERQPDGDAVLITAADKRHRVGASGGVLGRLTILGSPSADLAARFISGEPSSTPNQAGFRAPLLGSLWLLAVCAIAALPLGVGTAIVLEEYRPRRRSVRLMHGIVQTNIRNLAGVPSVVYGLIGLTVFARMFGAFGNPGQFTTFEEIITNDGQRIVGQVVEDRSARTYAIHADLFGTIELEVEPQNDPDLAARLDAAFDQAGLDRDQGALPLSGTIDLTDDFQFQLDTDQLGSLRLDAAQATDVDDAIFFADDFPTRPIESGSLDFVGAGELVVETPEQGRIVVDKSRIDDMTADRDALLVRRHIFTFTAPTDVTVIKRTTGDGRADRVEKRLAAGDTLRGSAIELDGDTVRLSDDPAAGDTFVFDLTNTDYRAKARFTLGDEDSVFFITLPFGTSVLAGGLTLMLVILPVIIIASQESLRSVPDSLREGGFALGATRQQVILGMTLPNALPGIMTGSILAMSRAIGEAAPILIIGGAGFVTFAPDNLMSGFAAMPLQIYSWTGDANTEFRAVAAAAIIVLLAVLFMFNAVAVLIRQRLQRELT
jgi:ABC-type phosphate transport system permease subunit